MNSIRGILLYEKITPTQCLPEFQVNPPPQLGPSLIYCLVNRDVARAILEKENVGRPKLMSIYVLDYFHNIFDARCCLVGFILQED